MNSDETGIQSTFCGIFGEKIETPDSKGDFQMHSFRALEIRRNDATPQRRNIIVTYSKIIP